MVFALPVLGAACSAVKRHRHRPDRSRRGRARSEATSAMAPLRGEVQVIDDVPGVRLRFARGADLLLFVLTLARIDPVRAARLADCASLDSQGGDLLLHLHADGSMPTC